MDTFSLQEQIVSLRKQKGVTQEQLAVAMGVTNQAVSKWEAGVCCPDIQLLPALAAYFEVTIDTLLGGSRPDSLATVHSRLKAYLHTLPEDKLYADAFRLALLLHEGVCTYGYRTPVPWNTERDIGLEEERLPWGYSACTEPEGSSVCRNGGVFLADHRLYEPMTPDQLRALKQQLLPLTKPNVLAVLFALFERTTADPDRGVPPAELAEACGLTAADINEALDQLPVAAVTVNGEPGWRLEGPGRLLPALLPLLIIR